MNNSKIPYILITFIAIVFILFIGKNLILPLAIAVMISYVINELKIQLSKITFKKKKLPNWLLTFSSFGIIVLLLILLGNVLYSNILSITEVIPTYQKNINLLVSKFISFEKIDLTLITKEWLNGDKIATIISTILDSLTSIFSNSMLILLYLVFIMLESSMFSKKIKLIYTNKESYKRVSFILKNINNSMSKYISLKTITSLTTGFMSYVVLMMLDIDFAFFWAFLIFALNFIPTIGSLIATLFPAIIALLQFGTFLYPSIVLLAIGSIQFLIGNVLEPKIMGNSLNVSPLVVLISLAFWGAIWGITGMVLSVPITIMIIITFSQFESTKWMAILLSENGDILKNN